MRCGVGESTRSINEEAKSSIQRLVSVLMFSASVSAEASLVEFSVSIVSAFGRSSHSRYGRNVHRFRYCRSGKQKDQKSLFVPKLSMDLLTKDLGSGLVKR